MSGWIKLHRRLLKSAKFGHPGLLHLWIFCLAKASWKDRSILRPGSTDELQIRRGQFVTGRRSLRSALYPERDSDGRKIRRDEKIPSESTVWRWLKSLENARDIELRSEQHYTIVTVCNYNTYQLREQPSEPQSNDQADQSRTNRGPIVNTNKKVLKKVKERNTKSVFQKPSIEQVSDYCSTRQNGIDPESFVDYYESVGWAIKGKSMKDWQAAVRTWEKRNKKPVATSKVVDLSQGTFRYDPTDPELTR
jgi:hypothetical protein